MRRRNDIRTRAARRRELTRSATVLLSLLLLVSLALAGGGVLGAFSSISASPGNNVNAKADWVGPSASRSVIGKAQGGVPGYIRQGGTYYVYADVTDSGNPASGVSTVNSNVSNITPGSTSVSLINGSFPTGGLSYNYRTGVQTANVSLSAGTYTYSLTSTDVDGNSQTQNGYTVIVDNTVPAGSDIQTANGGTAGRPESGDTVTYTFTEQIDPESVLSGWTGTSTAVRARITNSGSTDDAITIRNTADTVQLPMGSVDTNGDPVSATSTFNATMVQSGSVITVTLGSLVSGTVRTDSKTTPMVWTPAAAATDRAGNACSTTPITETGAADLNF